VYLHYALDLWFETVVKEHVRGDAMMCRYADDFVCAFRFREDAESFYRVLPKRQCVFKWLNRRGGKRKSFTWEAFERALDRLGIALPKITEVKRQPCGVCMTILFDAKASTTEEPDAGKLHIRVCAGGFW